MTNMFMRKAGVGLLALTLIAALVAFSPSSAFAGSCYGGSNGSVFGLLDETRENVAYPPGQGVRLAQASENGTLSNACGTLEGFNGSVTVHAKSRIPFFGFDASGNPILGAGPIDGSFQIKGDDVINGKLHGTLTFTQGSPVVQTSGGWSTNGDKGTTGAFTGLALVPFQYAGFWVYYDATGVLASVGYTSIGGSLVLLNPTDFNAKTGNPEAKFIITMYQ